MGPITYVITVDKSSADFQGGILSWIRQEVHHRRMMDRIVRKRNQRNWCEMTLSYRNLT